MIAHLILAYTCTITFTTFREAATSALAGLLYPGQIRIWRSCFGESSGGKPENPYKNPQRQEPTTNSTHI